MTPGAHAAHGRPIARLFQKMCSWYSWVWKLFLGRRATILDTEGVYSTAVGYAGGHTPNPTYEEVCSGQTGHSEVVLVAFQPDILSFEALLAIFWEGHDPTQGNRQGNDIGTQYRSVIYTSSAEMLEEARRTARHFGQKLAASGFGQITTVKSDQTFYYAEEYHRVSA